MERPKPGRNTGFRLVRRYENRQMSRFQRWGLLEREGHMKNRLGIALGLAALIVAALGSTSVGQAAERTLKATAGKVAGASPLASQGGPAPRPTRPAR